MCVYPSIREKRGQVDLALGGAAPLLLSELVWLEGKKAKRRERAAGVGIFGARGVGAVAF